LKFCSDGTVELAYRAFEQMDLSRGRPPVIIMHGLMGSSSNWYSISKALSKTGRKVITSEINYINKFIFTPITSLLGTQYQWKIIGQ